MRHAGVPSFAKTHVCGVHVCDYILLLICTSDTICSTRFSSSKVPHSRLGLHLPIFLVPIPLAHLTHVFEKGAPNIGAGRFGLGRGFSLSGVHIHCRCGPGRDKYVSDSLIELFHTGFTLSGEG